ncbi:AEC family transporter [Elioraea sp. Yellowstone]|uniref:AEC family transporter n=1 Tax=Elioraea sp. Yellowstone TaxID=2592070 RepID=UPI00115427CB|nr:AEC family transporter [Elioraea sp. Yellowstone]TQF77601.1 AEC family transporter [Elioraea sp. Yellowstone]
MDRLAAVTLAVVPVALLIGLGWGLRRAAFLPDPFWPGAERLCFVVLLPALLAQGLGTADLGGVPVAGMAAAIVAPLFVTAAVLVALRRHLGIDGPGFTSVLQGGIRFNNYIGLAASAALYGAPGVALAALANAAIVPTVNVMSVLAFARFGTARPNLAGTLKALATNPLILGCAIGAVWQATAAPVPGVVSAALRSLGQASLPIGLLCVGAAFTPRALRARPGAAAVASAAKFVLLPALTWLACAAFGVRGVPAEVTVLFAALPTATSSYIMSKQLGGDAPLMAGITTLQTLVAAATLPLTLALV